jgi:hypothetical protein
MCSFLSLRAPLASSLGPLYYFCPCTLSLCPSCCLLVFSIPVEL